MSATSVSLISRQQRTQISTRFTLYALIIAFSSLITVIGSGCPGGTPQDNLDGPCESVGTRCRLKPGVLGVCSPTQGGGRGQARADSLICTPQH